MKEGWEYKKLKEVGLTQTGTTPSKQIKAYYGGDIPFIRPAELNIDQNGGVQYDSELKLTEEGALKSRVINANSVLMCCIGSVGKTGYTLNNVTCNQQINTLTPYDNYNPRFVYYALISPFFQQEVIKIANSAKATLPIISKGKWEILSIPIPPLSEQQSIVDYLDSAFAKIDAMKANAEKALNEAKALFQASLKEMLEPKEGWEEKYLKDIAQYSIGLTYKPTNVCNDGTIVLRSSNIQEGKLDLKDIVRVNANIKEDLYVRTGDILMCSRNGSARLVGKVCIIPEIKEKMTYGTFMMIIRSAYNPLLYHYFDTGLFRSQIKHGEANMINQITRYMLDEVKLILPPVTEQQSIVETLDSLKSKVDRLQENYDKISQECDALKQAILRQVFE